MSKRSSIPHVLVCKILHSSAKKKMYIIYILWRIFQLFFRCNTRPKKKNHINFFSTSCDDRKLHRIKQNMDDLSSYNVLSFLKVWLFTLKCVYIYSIKINWTLWNNTYQCLILYHKFSKHTEQNWWSIMLFLLVNFVHVKMTAWVGKKITCTCM